MIFFPKIIDLFDFKNVYFEVFLPKKSENPVITQTFMILFNLFDVVVMHTELIKGNI